jgi:hypothetical protein
MEHLPECRLTHRCHGLTGVEGKHTMKMDYCEACCRPCICDELRACEQRVTEQWESLRGWGESYAYKTGSDRGFDAGYVAALDAAEAAINKEPRTTNLMITLQDALSAICGLREEK